MLKVIILENDDYQADYTERLVSQRKLINATPNSYDIELYLRTNDPQEVIDSIKDEAYLAILDIELDNQLSGIDVAEQIRKKAEFAEIIFVTAYQEYLPYTVSRRIEPFDYISKGKQIESIADRLRIDIDEADCGIASLAMILRNFGSIYPIAKLRDLARTTKQGTTALGLLKAAKHLGLDVIPIQADLSLFDDPEITYPLIAHVIKDDLLHYCVVFKADQDYIYVADPDPATKVQKMTRDEFGRLWSGVSLLFSPAKGYTPQKEPLAGLMTMFRQLTNYKKDISGIVIAALLITFISIVGSYYLQLIIDRFIPSKSINGLAILAGSLLVVYVFNSLFNYLRDVLLTRLDQKLTSQISLRYIHHVYRLPMRFFSTRKTGEITSRFNDINKIIDALSSTIISMFLDVGVMVIIGNVLFLYDRSLFLTTISTIPIYVIIIYAFNKRFAKLDQEQMESNAQLSSDIIEDLKGVETLKVLQLENIRYKNVEKQFADFLRKNLTYVKTKSFQDAIKMWIQYGLVTIILFQGAVLVIQGRLSIGILMAFNALLAFFISPLQNIIFN